ncbi:MAG: cobalamin-binding protein [Anaerolineales bacterium]|nr:cobalamin-binding protein [Anaerolineales bacterium]
MFRKTLFLTLLLTLTITACVGVSPSSGKLTFTDGLGRKVKLDAPAQRIVSLAPSNTEILFALGAGPQVIGRDELSDYPKEAKAIPSVGGSMGDFSEEAIVALKPDLVLAAGLNSPDLVASLEKLGLTVYFLSNPKTFEELHKNLETVAQLTGHEKEAAELNKSLKARVAAVDEKIMPLSYRPIVFFELDGTDPLAPWTAGPSTFIDQLIVRAGGVNVGADLKGDWAQISSENLVLANPQIILLGDALYGGTVESVNARPGWDVISAVKNDAIYPFNPDLASRPGPRLVDALEEMAKLLHPELFK